MDQNTLVEGGDAGLRAIAQAFREVGFPVTAIYLVQQTSQDGDLDWVVRVVLFPFRPSLDREFIPKLVQLERDKKLPFIDQQVRVDAVSPEHIEAARVLDYARRMGEPPVVIRKVMWEGLYIEYALVAEYDRTTAAAA